ncbi:MAG: hypothetical protein U0K54_01315 [Acutalibacteraceae bacterium]|nr:hypothetical protein [Acutalibacteraceae bacterium]
MKLRNIKILICLLCLIFVFGISAYASENEQATDITLIEMTPEDKEYYLKEFTVESVSTDATIYEKNFIYSFDVSDTGDCAIFFDNAAVVIMDSDGNLKKVIKFDERLLEVMSRSDTVIRWNGNNLDLIMSYDVLCAFTVDGEIIDVFNYETDVLHVPKPDKITVNEDVYSMKYSNILVLFPGGNRYDMLIKTNASGEKVLFDSQKALPNGVVSIFAYIIVINIVIAGILIYIFKFYRRQPTVWESDYNPLLHKNKLR